MAVACPVPADAVVSLGDFAPPVHVVSLNAASLPPWDQGAETMFKKCLKIRQVLGTGPDSPHAPAVASTMCNLGFVGSSQHLRSPCP